MSLETFSYGNHALQTVTVADLHPAQPLHDTGKGTGRDTRYWVMYILPMLHTTLS
jgi:hypothetical protein